MYLLLKRGNKFENVKSQKYKSGLQKGDGAMINFVCVSAQNSTDFAKQNSDYICTGKNDELVIQSAIDDCMKNDKNLYWQITIIN